MDAAIELASFQSASALASGRSGRCRYMDQLAFQSASALASGRLWRSVMSGSGEVSIRVRPRERTMCTVACYPDGAGFNPRPPSRADDRDAAGDPQSAVSIRVRPRERTMGASEV